MLGTITAPVKPAAAFGSTAPRPVQNAIALASSRTGVDAAYLTAKAAAESSFDPRAQASTSSARGLYQFIDQTWLATVKRHGAKHGLGREAAQIQADGNGRWQGSSPAVEQRILALRDNPRFAAAMAAELAADNRQYLSARVGGDIGNTELYLAHFLGARGAAQFIAAQRATPDAPAAQMFPAAAKANRAVFYDRQGQTRSLQQIFDRFAQRFERQAPSQADPTRGTGNPPAVTKPTADTREATVSTGVSPPPVPRFTGISFSAQRSTGFETALALDVLDRVNQALLDRDDRA